jgi:type III restriction enzyme
MLEEGWDVTNLYTIVPLRAANSRVLVEQSIGRGLRLPYGKRTGEDYIVRGLIDKDDINYDEHAELLYKLAGQMVRHLQSYLQKPEDVLNVLQFYQTQLVTLIHAQISQHYLERATEYEVSVSKGFQTLTSSMAAMQTDQTILSFRSPVQERLLIREMVFGGFTKCLYPAQKFDSDSERRFAIILEDDA